MTSPSTYIHSSFDNAEELSSFDISNELLQSMKAKDSNGNDYYIEATVRKLESIGEKLNAQAETFLQGYTPISAQEIADNEQDYLLKLLEKVLYGSNAKDLAKTLTREKTVDTKKIQPQLKRFLKEIGVQDVQEILSQINSTDSAGRIATILANASGGGTTIIDVTTAGSNIQKLGALLAIDGKIKNVEGQMESAVTAQVYKIAKGQVSTNKHSKLWESYRDILRNSIGTTQKAYELTIKNFCKALREEMISQYPNYIRFAKGENAQARIESNITTFCRNLQDELIKVLQDKQDTKLGDKSNVHGLLAEDIMATATQINQNTVMLRYAIGDYTDEQGVEYINNALKDSKNKIKKMTTWRDDTKQSLTDLVLYNTQNHMIARAQAKNHLVDYFTKDRTDQNINQIDNFRWMVADHLTVATLLAGLSKTELGMNLNNLDFDNIKRGMVQNIWFNYYGSATPILLSDGGGISVSGRRKTTQNKFLTELEGTLEQIFSGQVTNFLGVTIQANMPNPNVDFESSNIFYILNGRLVKTGDLILQAAAQLASTANLKLQSSQYNIGTKQRNEIDASRMVRVNIDTTGVSSVGTDSRGGQSLLVAKLQEIRYDESGNRENDWNDDIWQIGEEKGEEVLSAIKIDISLGTSIDVWKKSAYTG